MQLERLSLDDLNHLADRLYGVAAAMLVLRDNGFNPRANLNPMGDTAISFAPILPPYDPITVGWQLPHMEVVEAEERRFAASKAADTGFADSIPFDPAVYPPRPTITDAADGGENVRAAEVEVTGPIEPAPEAIDFTSRCEPVEAVTPGSARALAQTNQPPRWTEEEDARAVDLCVAAMMTGMTQSAAYVSVAHKLGRPIEGTKFRFNTKLKDRVHEAMDAAIDASVARARAAEIAPATFVPVATPVDPILPDAPNDLLGAHLASVDRRRGWTMARDLDLIELACAGWEMAAIGAELQVDAGEVKRRYDLLTDQHRDKADKLVRRFSRDQVLERLKQLAQPVAAE